MRTESAHRTAEATRLLPAVVDVGGPFRPPWGGWVSRGLVWALLAWAVLALPGNVASPFEIGVGDIAIASRAVIFAIIGLSLNVLIGHAGQISLGHQAFVGIGAFTAAYVVTDLGLSFWVAVPVAAGVGAAQAAVLGAISLRLTGLYFALVTLAYGLFAEEALFGIQALTGGEGGKPAPRPSGFEAEHQFYYLCLAFLALVLWVDWRLVQTKGGRALHAVRENPLVASSYGVNIKLYTLLAFTVSGVFAGIAGALFAVHSEVIDPNVFNFQLALIFILMTVVGGLRNRAGVVLGSAFFAVLDGGKLVEWVGAEGLLDRLLGLPSEFFALVVGPILLLLTLTLFPGGIGQSIAPLERWLLGQRFDPRAGKPRDVEVRDGGA